jgi:Na+/proline symporter
MHSATYKSLLLSIFILLMGVLTGFLLSRKIISNELSLELLKLETFVAVTIFSLQIFVYSRAKTQLFYQLLFIGFLGFSLILMLVSLFLPLFWVKHVAAGWKFLIASIFIVLATFNVFLAFRLYKKNGLMWDVANLIFFIQTK